MWRVGSSFLLLVQRYHLAKGPVHMGSQVPSPTHVSEVSQHGGEVPVFELKILLDLLTTIKWIIVVGCTRNDILGRSHILMLLLSLRLSHKRD